MSATKEKKRFRLIPQVMILFAIGILVTGVITYFTQRSLSDAAIRQQTEARASEIGKEVAASIREYPACDSLLSYWYAHAGEMQIEYDAEYGEDTETAAKCRALTERHPGIQLKYVTEQQFNAMAPEDQRLYAEIAYSWVITRLNQIKRANHIDFLFCVAADESYGKQFFLLSAADKGAVRGTSYEEVYTLGHVVTVGPDQQEAMRRAEENSSHLASAGVYVDYYTHLGEAEGHPVFIGLTYNLSEIRASAASQAHRETLYAMLFQIFLSLICLLLVFWFVLRPLKKVQANIRLYKQTKDSAMITERLKQIRTRNEIGDLSNDVTELTSEMDDYIGRIESITAEKQRVSTELSMATRIQAAMMPHVFPPFPERPEFDIYASMDPAKEVGGDFYDFFLIDDDHLGIVTADVSGKGVPAALFMMASKIILQSCAMLGGSPAEILTKTNEAICSNNQEEMFVTVWMGILEISSGRLTAANAGHEYPVIRHPDGGFELYKDKHGLVIGAMSGMKYSEYELQLTPGAKLFLYTDGLPEATDADGNMFGTERMLSTLNKEPDAAPARILQNVRSAVDDFVKDAEQFDDLTMLCLEYVGAAAGNGTSEELEIEATTGNLEKVLDFVNARLDTVNCPAGSKMKLDLAVEEVYVNIANYAYSPETGTATVRVEVKNDPPTVTITFIDRGVPFDPLAKNDPDVTLAADEREIGGLGIFMTKKLMDDVVYEYKDGRNILTLKKLL
ncbi:MAG: SpoIIE family protein phosphatase [Clostridia bacterium]|nr:SpoIIE family protein phosphatase [Clostridia bacterium]